MPVNEPTDFIKDDGGAPSMLDRVADRIEGMADGLADAKVEPHNPFDFNEADAEFNVREPVEDVRITDDVDTTHTIEPDGTVKDTDKSRISIDAQKFITTQARIEAIKVVKAYNEKAKELEDERANHRNHNRLYMLIVALIGFFTFPVLIDSVLQAPELMKFSAAMALVPDFVLTAWALRRRY